MTDPYEARNRAQRLFAIAWESHELSGDLSDELERLANKALSEALTLDSATLSASKVLPSTR